MVKTSIYTSPNDISIQKNTILTNKNDIEIQKIIQNFDYDQVEYFKYSIESNIQVV